MFSDGTIQKVSVEGERTIEFPNGQRETHTKYYKVSTAGPCFNYDDLAVRVRALAWLFKTWEKLSTR